jgi:hypothetical protein
MLEGRAGPVLLTDFPDDDPRETPDPHWLAPIATRAPAGLDGPALADAMQAELQAVAPAYAQSCTARGRSTVGLSGLAPAACGDYVAAWLRGPPPEESPVPEFSPILCLRFAVDDLKAYVLEAALAGGGRPSSGQLGDWLWNDTATGAAIRSIRARLLPAEDERAKLIAGMFLVPSLRVAQTA